MNQIGRALITLAIALLITLPAHAFEGAGYLLGSSSEGTHKLTLGARYNDEVKAVSGLPFEKGDVSWLLAYEYHEQIAFWQIGVDYAPKSSTESEAKVITPQISLIFKDDIYRLGAGALQSYVDIDGNTDWTALYFQMIAGVDIPLGSRASLGLYGCYVFRRWNELIETDENGLAANLILSWSLLKRFASGGRG